MASEQIFLRVLADDDALHTTPLPTQTICISTPLLISWCERQGQTGGLGEGRRVSERPIRLSHAGRLRYEHMFDTVASMHYEVDVVVQHPLDEQAERFLSSVQRSANRVIRFRGDDQHIVVTVEAHVYDREGAVRAAIREVVGIYPNSQFHPVGVPRLEVP